MKDKTGDMENKLQLLTKRSYASNTDVVTQTSVFRPPTLQDLNQIQVPFVEGYWVAPPFRIAVLVGSFFAFAPLANALKTILEIDKREFDIISGQFAPTVGILYGTFVALTLEILYERLGSIQYDGTTEAALLANTAQNVLNFFRGYDNEARKAYQSIADQVRILSGESRGAEMIAMIQEDPYSNLLQLVSKHEKRLESKGKLNPAKSALFQALCSDIPSLMAMRSKRLSDEAAKLPPTHYLVLVLLTGLNVVGFSLATLNITNEDGNPPFEACLVFASLMAIFTLCYNFCRDLNDPFTGVYQIKRSTGSAYLYQIKWLVGQETNFGHTIRFDDWASSEETQRDDARDALLSKYRPYEQELTLDQLESRRQKKRRRIHESQSKAATTEFLQSWDLSTTGTDNNNSKKSMEKKEITTAAASSSSASNSSPTSNNNIQAIKEDDTSPSVTSSSSKSATASNNSNSSGGGSGGSSLSLHSQTTDSIRRSKGNRKSISYEYFRRTSGFQ
eukprot:CAMPEP_0195302782 /NCGR_PEP_ID=MMETSP0707-20130614/31649_1 /TAXON_ID=33640 /ORGANISM="Asterionellopsis glacialis, Strain CCMP134" /LENGTH=504 /DNA_ID=CAMNT_0040366125 /DNA_START=81 /DNA_END=1595 /DNA_ORIENTATION=+